MNATSILIRWQVPLVLAVGLGWSAPRAAATTTNGVTQAWAVRISGPMFSTTEAGGITLGPSGDVFVAVRATAGERF